MLFLKLRDFRLQRSTEILAYAWRKAELGRKLRVRLHPCVFEDSLTSTVTSLMGCLGVGAEEEGLELLSQ